MQMITFLVMNLLEHVILLKLFHQDNLQIVLNMNLNISIEPSDRPVHNFLNSNAGLDFLNPANASDFGMLLVYLIALGTYEEIYFPEIYPYFFLANGQVAIINYSPTIKTTLLSKRAHGL